ncbi:hypothetical protein [Lolliginicoccus levis]|uniref:hypothetical protein n=1 Tax=Lolliginicoccus levis TaxID=2919542 RepID=UPI00241DA3B1|nr:hypothetical protein [Lolliginicoccus levis]
MIEPLDSDLPEPYALEMPPLVHRIRIHDGHELHYVPGWMVTALVAGYGEAQWHYPDWPTARRAAERIAARATAPAARIAGRPLVHRSIDAPHRERIEPSSTHHRDWIVRAEVIENDGDEHPQAWYFSDWHQAIAHAGSLVAEHASSDH